MFSAHRAKTAIASVRTIALALLLGLGLAACGSSSSGSFSQDVILATTTSTYDTGLLDVLIPDFQERTGYRVKPIAVGTGKALAMAERGEADVLLVHAPSAERRLLASGVVISRTLVMHNFFAIVGVAADPAGVATAGSPGEAMRRIAESQSRFISRGDDSGTHKMERNLWAESGTAPSGAWLLESGQGMAATLVIASEKSAYTLTDLGTYLSLKRNLRLEILLGADPSFLNIYSVLRVNGDRFSPVNRAGAKAFADYLVSPEAQAIIRDFGVARYGEPFFTADAGKEERELGS